LVRSSDAVAADVLEPRAARLFADLHAGKAWSDQITPFSFLASGHVRLFGQRAGVDATRFNKWKGELLLLIAREIS
jgi:hypothetical protein